MDRLDLPDRIEWSDSTDRIECTLARQPAEPTDKIEPAEPTDKIEPAEPMDRIAPFDPMLRIEFSELIDHFEPLRSFIPAFSHQRLPGLLFGEGQPAVLQAGLLVLDLTQLRAELDQLGVVAGVLGQRLGQLGLLARQLAELALHPGELLLRGPLPCRRPGRRGGGDAARRRVACRLLLVFPV